MQAFAPSPLPLRAAADVTRRATRATPARTRACAAPAVQPQLSRRCALVAPLLLPALALRVAPPAIAAEVDPLGEGQPVRPALPAAAYVKQLRANRAPALEQLRQLIASGDFAGISVALVLAPFDDLRQACYFLPWAVVRTDEASGTALQDGYIAIRAAWKGLDDAAYAAARFTADETDVTAALAEFERALDAFEARIPASLA